MILTLLGTHGQQFNRLLEAVDGLAASGPRICQTGHSSYRPQGECHAFLPYEKTIELIVRAGVVICHAGTGTVMSALNAGKCPVVAPRFRCFGEHIDDHQLELTQSLSELGLIVPYMPGDDLAACVQKAGERSVMRKMAPDAALCAHLHQAVRAAAFRRTST